jgi:hypothetical protein
MKVSLKSKGIDLEVDNVEKLQDVLDFVQKFKDIEVQAEAAKLKLESRAAKSTQVGKKKRAK